MSRGIRMAFALNLLPLLFSAALIRSDQNMVPPRSFIIYENVTYDCIDIYKQPGLDHPLLKNHTIQMKPSVSRPELNDQSGKNKTYKKKMGCPDGTVPILRNSKEYFSNAQLFANKYFHPLTGDSPGTHIAGVRSSDGPFWGVEAWFDGFTLNVGRDQASYSQVYIGSGLNNQVNFIQTGYMINPSVFGDGHLWTYGFWKHPSGQVNHNDRQDQNVKDDGQHELEDFSGKDVQVDGHDAGIEAANETRNNNELDEQNDGQDEQNGGQVQNDEYDGQHQLGDGNGQDPNFDRQDDSTELERGHKEVSKDGQDDDEDDEAEDDYALGNEDDEAEPHDAPDTHYVSEDDEEPADRSDKHDENDDEGHGKDGKGCYNTACPGFIQVSHELPIGKPISVGPGVPDWNRVSIHHDLLTGNWWLTQLAKHPHNIDIGYWPPELFDLIGNGASLVGVGGAVQASRLGPSPPMGNGKFPNGDLKGSSLISNIQVLDSNEKLRRMNYYRTEKLLDSPKCYGLRIGKVPPFHDTQLGFFLNYGGPGGNSCGI